jgi:putative hydrolase of the HAD superfamily
MAPIRGLVFDLDDTLYLEREYVRSGYRSVSTWLDGLGGCSGDEIFAHLWSLFEQRIQGDTFDRLLRAYPALTPHVQVEALVSAYRAHRPRIMPGTGVVALLRCWRERGYRMGLLSDGPLACQQEKVAAIGLKPLFAPVVLTDRWGREFWKPHPRGYQQFEAAWGLAPGQLVYIGDNPDKDFVTPRRRGWHTIRLRTPGQLRCEREPVSSEYAADREISHLRELEEQLTPR